MKTLAEEEQEVGVPLAPMIDIVFLLLIFFLTATSFYKVEKDISIQLPEASEGEAASGIQKDIVVNVRKAGILVVNGKIVTLEALEEQFKEAQAANPEQAVVIRGDKLTLHQYIVRVMNTCLKTNITNVNVAVFKTEE